MLKQLMSVVSRMAGIALLALLLWSMRFRFDHIVVDGETYLVRVSRLSGHADVLIPGEGWVPSEDAWSDEPATPPTSTS